MQSSESCAAHSYMTQGPGGAREEISVPCFNQKNEFRQENSVSFVGRDGQVISVLSILLV